MWRTPASPQGGAFGLSIQSECVSGAESGSLAGRASSARARPQAAVAARDFTKLRRVSGMSDIIAEFGSGFSEIFVRAGGGNRETRAELVRVTRRERSSERSLLAVSAYGTYVQYRRS